MLELDSWDCHLNKVTFKKRLVREETKVCYCLYHYLRISLRNSVNSFCTFWRTNYFKWFGTTLIKPIFDLPLKADMWRYFSSYVFSRLTSFCNNLWAKTWFFKWFPICLFSFPWVLIIQLCSAFTATMLSKNWSTASGCSHQICSVTSSK